MAKVKKYVQKRKILIMEYYFIFQQNGLKSVADDLSISYNYLRKLVCEYKKNDGLIIRSTIN